MELPVFQVVPISPSEFLCLRNLEVVLKGRASLLPLHREMQEFGYFCKICLIQTDVYCFQLCLKAQKPS